MTTRYIGIKEFRATMPKILARMEKKKERVIVTKSGVPMFEVRLLSEKEKKVEKLAAAIAEGVEDVRRGRTYTHKEIKKMFGL